MALSAYQITLLCVIGIVLLARPALAFGAGNIGSTSKIEGENWRHGDLEDTLLTLVASRAMGGKKFSKLDVKRVYFGNWLRDYSQAVDVGTVKHVSAEAIRVVLWILGFMSFGYGTKEFEVTTERLGCYRPEEHIDNPKDYADNEDARQYDRRLRGPVDERRELAIDPELGLKAYIASENLGITTSAGLIRNLFGRSIELGRRYARNNNKNDLYEALRLLGTGCHCLEDFSAHSNYTELALIELGERDVFPHVGRNCQVNLRTARHRVYPIVTGTFGGVDFLHSVTGEFDDKATQSEIQELEGTLQQAQNQSGNISMLQDLLNKIPGSVFGGKNEAGRADELKQNAVQHQMSNTRVSPRQPEEWLRYVNDVQKQIYPILEWHDEIMQSITETVEKIPILPDLIESIQEQVNIFVFSLLAPFVLPIISSIKNELNTGSNTIIQSSVEKQHIVFRDDNCSDPTHSMLSKDHFSNVLNEPAGKVAGQVLKWAVPQIIAAWDDERVPVERTLNRIIRGVFHHPALRDQGDDGAADGRRLMFGVVERWWHEKSDRERDGLRDQLSRRGVEQGQNHKPGIKDHGHGSAKALGMPNVFTANHPGAPGGFGGPSVLPPGLANDTTSQLSQLAGEAVGGGAIGSLVGGIAGTVGGGILAGAFGGNDNSRNYNQTSYANVGSRTDTIPQYSGRSGSGNYEQSQDSRTNDRYGGRTEYSSYTQSSYNGGYPTEPRHEEQTSYGGGYSPEPRRHEEQTSYGGDYSSESRRHGSHNQSFRRREDEFSAHSSTGFDGGRSNYDQGERITGYAAQQSFGGRTDDEHPPYGRRHDEDERPSHGRRNEHNERISHDRRDEGGYEHSRRDESGYGSSTHRRNEESYGSSGYGRSGRNEYGSGEGYGRQETSSYGGSEKYDRSDRDEYSSGAYGRHEADECGSGGRRGVDEYDPSRYEGHRRRGGDDEDMPGGFGEGDEGGFGRPRRGEGEYGGNGYGEERSYGY